MDNTCYYQRPGVNFLEVHSEKNPVPQGDLSHQVLSPCLELTHSSFHD